MTTAPLDYAQAQEGGRKIAQARRARTDDLREAIIKAAESEIAYQKALSRRMIELRDAGVAATVCKDQAKGEDAIADLGRARAIDAGMVLVQQSRIQEVEGERATFHRLVEWSMKLNTIGVE